MVTILMIKKNNDFNFPKGSIVKAGAIFKQNLKGIKLTRKHNPTLFFYDPVLDVYTGDFIEYVNSEFELSFS